MMKDGPAAQVLQLVRERTGKSVHVEPDPSFPANVLARLDVARGPVPVHRIAIHPSVVDAPEYLIVFQAGFLLRRFAMAAEQRRDFAETKQGEETVRGWVEGSPKSAHFDPRSTPRLVRFLASGLLSQLRSVPVGLRVDAWVRREFPELAALQRKALDKHLNYNAAGLRPEVQRAMPDDALRASLGMNAAFGLFWARLLDLPQFVLPYRAAGYEKLGARLLEAWDNCPPEPANDCRLVDAWAAVMGISGWYEWIEEGR